MSHIETGNTKLSLPVFVDIANALSVQTDELLHDAPQHGELNVKQKTGEILETCTLNDMYILLDVMKSAKIALKKYALEDK